MLIVKKASKLSQKQSFRFQHRKHRKFKKELKFFVKGNFFWISILTIFEKNQEILGRFQYSCTQQSNFQLR